MSGKMKEAKEKYYWDEFRAFVLQLEGLSNDDFSSLALNMQELVMNSTQRDPITMFFEVIEQAKRQWKKGVPFPIQGDWHHFLVPGVILSALRNNGYEISDQDIAEGMQRGAQARVSCGFTGICGGANSIGSVVAVVKRATPLHEDERQELMRRSAYVLLEISQIKRRCCKRSSYITLKETIKYLAENNYFLPYQEINCIYSSQNNMCAKEQCPFWTA